MTNTDSYADPYAGLSAEGLPDDLRLGEPVTDATHAEFLQLLAAMEKADDAGFLAAFEEWIEHTRHHFEQDRPDGQQRILQPVFADMRIAIADVEAHDRRDVRHHRREPRRNETDLAQMEIDHGAGPAYRPRNTGARFSTKAFAASL